MFGQHKFEVKPCVQERSTDRRKDLTSVAGHILGVSNLRDIEEHEKIQPLLVHGNLPRFEGHSLGMIYSTGARHGYNGFLLDFIEPVPRHQPFLFSSSQVFLANNYYTLCFTLCLMPFVYNNQLCKMSTDTSSPIKVDLGVKVTS